MELQNMLESLSSPFFLVERKRLLHTGKFDLPRVPLSQCTRQIWN